jgi:hypothetical protein
VAQVVEAVGAVAEALAILRRFLHRKETMGTQVQAVPVFLAVVVVLLRLLQVELEPMELRITC